MRRLRLLIAGRRANGERGVVAVFTAILVMFVAVGMLALTVDLGNITYNRAQLQNGADATSLALASACAKAVAGDVDCNVTADLTTLAVNNAHATDQSMSVRTDDTTCINSKGAAYVTAHGGTTSLPTCPATEDTASLSSCQPWPLTVDQSAVSYVETTTQTKMKKDGSNILPFDFGQILNNGGPTGTTQNTCSRAAWGPAGNTGATLPLTMGACDWQQASSKGTRYATAPPYSVAPNTGSAPPPEVISPTNLVTGIFSHATDDNLCSNQPNGGFSWLEPDSASDPTCTVTIGDGDSAPTNPGGSVPCKNVLASFLGKVVTVPIFDYVTGTGDNASYHVMGVAAFYFAGYDNVPSAQPNKTMSVYTEPSTVCAGKCTGSTTYVWGWFVSTLLPIGSGSIGSGQDLGAEVVVPAG